MNQEKRKRAEAVQRGMPLLGALGEVMPGDADERVAAVYDDIRPSLRVPFVNFIFRALANEPDFLEAAWARLAPAVRTVAFEAAADALRTRALLEPTPDPPDEHGASLGDLAQIRPYTDAIHYVLPKLLLVATAWESGLDRSDATAPGREPDRFPASIAPGTKRVELVDPEEATGQVKDVFEDIQQTHEHPGVASYYRALAQWPAFLAAAWRHIRPQINTPAYEQRKRELVDAASRAVREMAAPAASRSAPADPMRSVLAVFRFRLIPDLLLDVTQIKALLDGAAAARASRFSVAENRS